MRQRELKFGLGRTRIEDVELRTKSRDDIPALLLGLKAIYVDEDTRERLFRLLETEVAPLVSHDQGRPGMDLWPMLVLGVLKAGLDCDWDRLDMLAHEMKSVRQMMGLGDFDEGVEFERQTLIDNVSLLTPALLAKVNELAVATGHKVVGKKPGAPLHGRVDSYVVETDVRHPTDVGLLRDAMCASIKRAAKLAKEHGLSGWRQHAYWTRELSKLHNTVRRPRDWRRKDRVRDYLSCCRKLTTRLRTTRRELPQADIVLDDMFAKAELLIDQVKRRLLKGEIIPHDEKIFSVFEPHTRWIVKGKAKVNQELGVPVTVLEDEHGFLLGTLIQWTGGDVDAAAPLVTRCQERFPDLVACSFDRGFHSPANQSRLDELLELNACPAKGYRNQAAREREATSEFSAMRRWHSGVESAINHLEHHGLARVRAHGRDGFERTVGLATLAANLHTLGKLLRRGKRRRATVLDGRNLPLAA